jgi:hypothetical protein
VHCFSAAGFTAIVRPFIAIVRPTHFIDVGRYTLSSEQRTLARCRRFESCRRHQHRPSSEAISEGRRLGSGDVWAISMHLFRAVCDVAGDGSEPRATVCWFVDNRVHGHHMTAPSAEGGTRRQRSRGSTVTFVRDELPKLQCVRAQIRSLGRCSLRRRVGVPAMGFLRGRFTLPPPST